MHTSPTSKIFHTMVCLDQATLFLSLLILSTLVKSFKLEVKTTGMSKVIDNEMKVLAVRKAKVTHPTGDPNFSVMQAGFASWLCKKVTHS